MAAATQLQLHTLSQDEIENLVFLDSLCKLPNRRFLEQRIPELLSSLEGAALFCFRDIDHFKQANQTGHAFGDALLAAFSQRLLSVLRADDVIARFGGDEFVLIVRGLHPESLSSQGTVICERLLEQMRKPFQIQQTQYHYGDHSGKTIHIPGRYATPFSNCDCFRQCLHHRSSTRILVTTSPPPCHCTNMHYTQALAPTFTTP